MALILNEEQQSLKDIAKDFLEKNAPVTHFREIRDTANETGYSQELNSTYVISFRDVLRQPRTQQ